MAKIEELKREKQEVALKMEQVYNEDLHEMSIRERGLLAKYLDALEECNRILTKRIKFEREKEKNEI